VTRKPARTTRKAARKTAPKASRSKPAVRASQRAKPPPSRKGADRPRVAGPGTLTWSQGGPRLRSAPSRGGTYVLLSHDGVDWTAEWRPTKGRPNTVLFRKPVEACVVACERDQVLRFTNDMLVASGAEALAATDLQGDAVAWKRRRF
jgi:hypothetical protein